MDLMLDMHEVRALSNQSKRKERSTEVILERLKKTRSLKRRLPMEESSDVYLCWLSKLSKETLIRELYSEQAEVVLRALRALRAYMSASSIAPISAVIDLQLLPRLVECLDAGEAEVEFEASWVLTKLAVGSSVHIRYLVEAGVVDGLVRLLQAGAEKVRLQAVWALANVAGDLEDFKRHVLERGALPGVVHVLSSTKKQAARLKCTWALENLCSKDGDPDRLLPVWPAVRDLLRLQNEDVDLASFKVLAKISAHQELVKEMVDGGLLADIQAYLGRGTTVCSYALKVIANIANTTEYKQKLFDKNILRHLVFLMDSPDVKILWHIGEIILNLTNGNIEQIQTVLESQLLNLFWAEAKEQSEEKIQNQTVSIILNILNKGSYLHKKRIYDNGVIRDLSYVLGSQNDHVLYHTLCCLEKFLIYGDKESKNNHKLNQVACELVNCGGLEALEQLMSHESEDVYLKAYDIVETFFDEDERNEFDLEEMYERSINASTD